MVLTTGHLMSYRPSVINVVLDPNTLPVCKSCGNTDLDYGTRIIGYLKRISSFSKARQEEAGLRYYTRIKNSK